MRRKRDLVRFIKRGCAVEKLEVWPVSHARRGVLGIKLLFRGGACGSEQSPQFRALRKNSAASLSLHDERRIPTFVAAISQTAQTACVTGKSAPILLASLRFSAGGNSTHRIKGGTVYATDFFNEARRNRKRELSRGGGDADRCSHESQRGTGKSG